jgi:hypothetical protein
MNAIGALLLTAGLFFAAQGAGLVEWPPESFMVEQRQWIGYGLGIAALGLGLLWQSRRR